MATLKHGDIGKEVMDLQRALVHLGYLPSDNANSVYDHVTVVAVCCFQSTHKLDITGVCDAETRARLNYDLVKKG